MSIHKPIGFAFALVASLGVSLPLAHAGGPSAPSAKDVMDRNEVAQRVRDVTAAATITTGEPSGETRVKSFTMWRRLESDGVHFATLTRFSAPAEIRNEAILFEEHAGDENDVQLYLPRYKKVRRVEAQSQSSSFMGSTMSYSDIATPHVDDYNHKLLRSEPCPGEAGVSCHVIELTPKTDAIAEQSGYGRTLQWIRSDIFMSVQTELYNRTGKLWKRIVSSEIKEVDTSAHRFFAHSLRVDDLLGKRFTTLKFEQVKANTGLSDTLFTAQNLSREM